VTRWEIIETTEYSEWLAGLSREQRQAIRRSTRSLREEGPSLGRPIVDTVKGSELKNLKEMRVSSKGKLRILFIFDYQRRAILLCGGDKAKDSEWNQWYRTAIPRAEQIYKRFIEIHRRDQ
jgi:hypothetical protein